MASFKESLRRIITGDDAQGRSMVILDSGPSSIAGEVDVAGLFEIWEDAACGPLDPGDHADLGTKTPVLGPRPGNVQVRWFAISPTPEGVAKADLDAGTRERFAAFGGAHHMIDQSRHPAMHETHSIDIICLLQGEASLILEDGETRIRPGQVVIQRGTNHAWEAHGGPALFLAVLIDRELVGA